MKYSNNKHLLVVSGGHGDYVKAKQLLLLHNKQLVNIRWVNERVIYIIREVNGR